MKEPHITAHGNYHWQLAEYTEGWPFVISEEESQINIRWMPEMESKAKVKQRFFDELDRIEKLCIERGLRPSKPKYMDSYLAKDGKRTVTGTAYRHFDWLVEYQVLERGWTEIAKQWGVSRGTVIARVAEVAELIELTLRQSQIGRPKEE